MTRVSDSHRAARLAARLRENLHRRKAQARGRQEDEPAPPAALPKPQDDG